jgi:hypothetical protein
MITGTSTLFFISKNQIPNNKKPTYMRVVCTDHPEKANMRRTRCGLVAATALTIQATKQPQLPISRPPNYYLIVSSVLQMADS